MDRWRLSTLRSEPFTATLPHAILLLLLAEVAIGGAVHPLFQQQCPQGCLCVPDVINSTLLGISCRWSTLDEGLGVAGVRAFPKNSTKSLTIHCTEEHHKLMEEEDRIVFRDGLLDGFDHLVELKLVNCQSGRLTARMFDGASRLRSLHLMRLSVRAPLALPSGLFNEMAQLEKLSITESLLETIPEGLFCTLRYVQILNVSSNRLIDTRLGIDDVECVLDHLVIYHASGNKIHHLLTTALTPFPALRQLELASNGLSTIDMDAFQSTPLLQSLHLQDNQLKELPPLPETMTHLNLANNLLPLVPLSVANLPALSQLDISNNQIDSSTPFSLDTSSLESLDLSRNNLRDLPIPLFFESASTLKLLNLDGNRIEAMEPFALQNFTELHELRLSRNALQVIPLGSFAGLHELSRLHLDDNSIHRVDVEAFGDLGTKLHSLNMSNNSLIELPMAIQRLARIRRMHFADNQIKKVYKFVLNKLPHLSKLDLSNNAIEAIDSYEFSDSHLAELLLARNKIETLSADAFDKCPHLRKLDLSENRLHELGDALKQLGALRELNLTGNELGRVRWREFPPELLELYLSQNKISGIGDDASPHTRIRRLELSHNILTELSADQVPPAIEELNLSHNRLRALPRLTLADRPHIRLVDLRANELRTLPKGAFEQAAQLGQNRVQLWLADNPLECSCEMSWLGNELTAQASNKASSIGVMDLNASKCLLPMGGELRCLNETGADDFLCPYDLLCEPRCPCCDYGNCDCKSKCPRGCSCFRDASNGTNVVRCDSVGDGFSLREIPMHASHILLSNLARDIIANSTLKGHSFIGRTRLIELHLNSSGLEKIEPLALNTLPRLKVLHLANNRLTRLNGDEAFMTNRVTLLNLRGNKLEDVDSRLGAMMPNLNTLLLDGNRLEKLPHYLTNAHPKLKSISIGENPFRCDCSRTGRFAVQHWFRENQHRLLRSEGVLCVENITRAFLLNDTTVLSTFPPNLDTERVSIPMADFLRAENHTICATQPEGIFGGTAGRSTALMITLSAILLLTIAAVTYLLLSSLRMGRKKGGGPGAPRSALRNAYRRDLNLSVTNSPGGSPLQYPLIQFDIFISYSMMDEQWVVDNLSQPLERQGYSVGLLHQDGPRYSNALHSISDELTRQLEASQTLIIVLTRHFLENEWRTVQIRASHKVVFAKLTKMNKKLIAIIGDDVRTNELDNELGQILRRNTRIQLSHQLFRNMLMSNLPRRESPIASETSQLYSDIYGSVGGASGDAIGSANGAIVPSDIV